SNATPEEAVLEKRSRDLQKQAKTLQEQVDRSGIGADMKPVPAPTVRDLSVSKPSKGRRARQPAQPEPPKEPAPADEAVVIPAREVAAATLGDILGKQPQPSGKQAEDKSGDANADASTAEKTDAGDKAPEPKPEPVVHISGLPADPASLSK